VVADQPVERRRADDHVVRELGFVVGKLRFAVGKLRFVVGKLGRQLR
jgi:hypothetical protein